MPKGPSKRKPSPVPQKKIVRADGTVSHVRYSKSIAQEICERLAGGEVWFKICNTGRMPSYATLYDWRRRHPEFAEAYAQAKEMAADLRADKALVVAEESTPATVQSDRLRVGALQWRAAKGSPRQYGPRAGEPDDIDEETPRRLIIEVRHFEKVTRPDGSVYVREIPRARPGEEDGH